MNERPDWSSKTREELETLLFDALQAEIQATERIIMLEDAAKKSELYTAIARKKLSMLVEEGNRVCCLAFCKDETYGLITDFGKVLWIPKCQLGD